MDQRMELVDVIRRVRNRWRLRLALRGAVVVVAGTSLALLLSASSLESLRFSAPAIIAFRIISYAVFCLKKKNRQVIYERFFFGDPVRMQMATFASYDRLPYVERLREVLARAH